ncbi:hypothetical protein BKA67DRAFT_105138 [Truncatella angustata]|uniref:Uncharacterized protein n=1 Tax=Truncatella angustata TaxID=152316 RepID=A0A9P8RN35_9PEZI|nr:uncharacterized protein BKA67DRAFT_105138 [Truncatella angustata]KAH6646470.1 hypothetical protein BKA67DRAFT_105138 [Truncatella angustata]
MSQLHRRAESSTLSLMMQKASVTLGPPWQLAWSAVCMCRKTASMCRLGNASTGNSTRSGTRNGILADDLISNWETLAIKYKIFDRYGTCMIHIEGRDQIVQDVDHRRSKFRAHDPDSGRYATTAFCCPVLARLWLRKACHISMLAGLSIRPVKHEYKQYIIKSKCHIGPGHIRSPHLAQAGWFMSKLGRRSFVAIHSCRSVVRSLLAYGL